MVERLMERVFTRATHSHLQPVEIGKRLVRCMDSEQSVGMDGVLVPNVYDVYLSAADYAQFEPARRSLAQNMETHLSRVARQKHYHLMSRPMVRLQVDKTLSRGDIRVVPHLQDVEEPEEPAPQHTSILPTLTESAVHRERPTLTLDGQSHAVLRSPTTLGRLPDNDVVINDRRVSRHHAEIVQSGTRWLVRDMGSTNGTAVNGKVIKEAVLKPGDLISLGGVEATWGQ